ncbi:MAG: response regulator [Acidobacteria bacterium]|nr:response regulator [Acidobacteriota bacterium]
MRTLIVDDEMLARAVLKEMLASQRDVEVIGECANGFEAVKQAAETKPDLVLLDVQMPKLDGFETLELLGADCAVIFVTAFDSYAMRAFEVHAVDYLLKPFTEDRLAKALDRARQRLGQQGVRGEDLAAAARGPLKFLERVVARDGPKVHVIPVDKLDYIEAQEDYIGLHAGGKTVLKQQTISSLEAALDPKKFVRVHRSFVVNLERVARVEPYGANSKVAVLTTGDKLPVSRSGYLRLEELLGS